MRGRIYIAIFAGSVMMLGLCVCGVRACDRSGPCYYEDPPGSGIWLPMGCVATGCTGSCTQCNTSTCACESTCSEGQECCGGSCGTEEWGTGDPITVGTIDSPADGACIGAGDTVTLSCSGWSDTDYHFYCDGDVWKVEDPPPADGLSYTWSVTAGSFVNEDNTGASVEWIAPDTGGDVTITVTVDDSDTEGRDDSEVSTFITVTVQEWISEPAIKVYGIYKDHDQSWFHISQSCGLSIEAFDEDSRCEPDGGNHILGRECKWYGRNLSDNKGLTVTWDAPKWTEGDVIYATIDDDPDEPDGANTDDASVDSPTVTLRAWETMLVFSVSSTVDGSSTTRVLTESGIDSDGISAALSGGLAKGPVTAATTTTGSEATLQVHNDGPYPLGAAEVNATWEMKKIPSSAETYTGTGKCYLTASMSGELSTTSSDDDLDLFDQGSVTVSIGASIPGTDIGVDISTSIDIPYGKCEAAAGIGFGFNSDILADCLDGVYKIEDQSSHADPGSMPFSHSASQFFSGGFDTEKRACAKVDGKVEAKGYVSRAVPPFPGTGYIYEAVESSASMTSTGSCWYVCSVLMAENLYLSSSGILITP